VLYLIMYITVHQSVSQTGGTTYLVPLCTILCWLLNFLLPHHHCLHNVMSLFRYKVVGIKILLLKSNKCTSLVMSTLNKIKVTIKSHNKNSNMFRITQEPSSGSPPVLG
jgi:hypothetical protein